MALIKCKECGKEVSNKAVHCPNCGAPIMALEERVNIRFPVTKGLVTQCRVCEKSTNKVIAKGKQGETVTFPCKEPMEIYVVVTGCFGKPETTVYPGDKYDVGFRGFWKIYLSKVDMFSGGPITANSTNGWNF